MDLVYERGDDLSLYFFPGETTFAYEILKKAHRKCSEHSLPTPGEAVLAGFEEAMREATAAGVQLPIARYPDFARSVLEGVQILGRKIGADSMEVAFMLQELNAELSGKEVSVS